MQAIVFVFLGAGLGGVLRHLVNLGVGRWLGTDFPYATLIINVTGSALMGLFIGWLAFRTDVQWSQSLRLFVATGVLGGYTTFSSFSLETILLVERNQAGLAMLYVGASLAAGLAALWASLMLVRGLS